VVKTLSARGGKKRKTTEPAVFLIAHEKTDKSKGKKIRRGNGAVLTGAW